MEEKSYMQSTLQQLLPLIVFLLLVIIATFVINRIRLRSEREQQNIMDFNGAPIRLELRKPLQFLQLHRQSEAPVSGSRNSYTRVPETDPGKNPEYVLLLAERDIEVGRLEQAEDRLRTALVFHEKNVKLHALLGNTLYMQEKYREAEIIFRRQAYLTPQDDTVFNNLGTALAKQKRFKEAINTLRQVLKNNPDSASVILNLAGMYSMDHDKENAIVFFRKAYEKIGPRIILFAQDRNFDNIRHEPEFMEIVEQAKEQYRILRTKDRVPLKEPVPGREKK